MDTTSTRYRKRPNGEHMETDIVAVNGREAVVVEVKTTLRPEAMRSFVGKSSRFQDWFPDHPAPYDLWRYRLPGERRGRCPPRRASGLVPDPRHR